jgi:hypothetical protein
MTATGSNLLLDGACSNGQYSYQQGKAHSLPSYVKGPASTKVVVQTDPPRTESSSPTQFKDNNSTNFGGNSIGDDAQTDQQSTFGIFRKLPLEIRLMIWQKTILAQYIVIWQERRHELLPRHHVSRVNIPVALHVCQESRQELLTHYTLLQFDNGIEEVRETWDGTASRKLVLPRLTPAIYINFATDTLVFPGNAWQEASYRACHTFQAMGNHSKKIRSIAISKGDPTSSCWIDQEMLRSVSKLPSLQSIYILEGTLHASYEVMRDYEFEVYDPSQRHQQPYILDRCGSGNGRNVIGWLEYRTKLENYVVEMWNSAWDGNTDIPRLWRRPMPLKGFLTYNSLSQSNNRDSEGEDAFCLGVRSPLHWITWADDFSG